MERQTASYIADMLLELRNLAKGQGMVTLQGLLEISYYEAFEVANPVQISEDERERLKAMDAEARRAIATVTSKVGGLAILQRAI